MANPVKFAVLRGTGEKKSLSELKRGDVFEVYMNDGTQIKPRWGDCNYFRATSNPWKKDNGSTQIRAEGVTL